jgi:hypothetical protein
MMAWSTGATVVFDQKRLGNGVINRKLFQKKFDQKRWV